MNSNVSNHAKRLLQLNMAQKGKKTFLKRLFPECSGSVLFPPFCCRYFSMTEKKKCMLYICSTYKTDKYARQQKFGYAPQLFDQKNMELYQVRQRNFDILVFSDQST